MDTQRCKCVKGYCYYNYGQSPLLGEECRDEAHRWKLIRCVVWIIVAFILIWGALSFSKEADAAGLPDRKDLAILYATAHSMSGLPLPDTAPVIELISQAKMCEILECKHARTAGVYRDGRIYVLEDSDWTDPYDRSILIHEMVHYLQVKAHGEPQTCHEWANSEIQAYGVQAALLEKIGFDTRRILFMASQFITVCYRENAKKSQPLGMTVIDPDEPFEVLDTKELKGTLMIPVASSAKLSNCQIFGDYVVKGAKMHSFGLPRDLKWVTHEDRVKISQDYPKWMEQWPLPYNIILDEGESAELKAIIVRGYQRGWDLHNDFKPIVEDAEVEVCMNSETL